MMHGRKNIKLPVRIVHGFNLLKPKTYFMYHQLYLLIYLLYGAESFLRS